MQATGSDKGTKAVLFMHFQIEIWEWKLRVFRGNDDEIVRRLTAITQQYESPPQYIRILKSYPSNHPLSPASGKELEAVREAEAQGWVYDFALEGWLKPTSDVDSAVDTTTPYSSFRVHLDPNEHGLIPISIESDTDKVHVHLSDCYHSAEFIITWLEAVAEGRNSVCTIDLEGGYLRMAAMSLPGTSSVRLMVGLAAYLDDEWIVDVTTTRFRIVKTFYHSITTYAASPEYDESLWAYVAVKDDLTERFSNFPFDDLIDADRNFINSLFSHIYPKGYKRATRSAAYDQRIQEFLDDFKITELPEFIKSGAEHKSICIDPDNVSYTIVYPVLRRVNGPEGPRYEQWSRTKKKKTFDGLYNKSIYDRYGDNLRQIKSEIVEAFLGEHENGDE